MHWVRLVLSYWRHRGAANDRPTGKANQYEPWLDDRKIDEAYNYIRERISEGEQVGGSVSGWTTTYKNLPLWNNIRAEPNLSHVGTTLRSHPPAMKVIMR